MNKPHLLRKIVPVGVAAFSVLAFTTTHAQAAVIGELEWGDATSNFFDDVFEGGTTFTDFEVTFNPGDLADSFDTQGIFVPPLEFADPANPQLLDAPAVTAAFNLVGDGTGDTAIYELESSFDFVIADADNNQGAVTVTFGINDTFLAAKNLDNGIIVGVDLEETFSDASLEIDGIPGTFPDGSPNFPNSSVEEILTFGILDGAEFGEYGAEVLVNQNGSSVPEPTSILGLIAIASLGLGLKHKKKLLRAE